VNNKLTFISTGELLPMIMINATMITIVLAAIDPQINSQQSKLLEIALDLSNNYSQHIESPRVLQIKDYQIWRDKDHVAIINATTQKLIVFGSTKFESTPQPIPFQNITHQSLWKKMKGHYVELDLAVTTKEIVVSFEFLKPLDPIFKILNQSSESN
jgi:hypothetical protein